MFRKWFDRRVVEFKIVVKHDELTAFAVKNLARHFSFEVADDLVEGEIECTSNDGVVPVYYIVCATERRYYNKFKPIMNGMIKEAGYLALVL